MYFLLCNKHKDSVPKFSKRKIKILILESFCSSNFRVCIHAKNWKVKISKQTEIAAIRQKFLGSVGLPRRHEYTHQKPHKLKTISNKTTIVMGQLGQILLFSALLRTHLLLTNNFSNIFIRNICKAVNK